MNTRILLVINNLGDTVLFLQGASKYQYSHLIRERPTIIETLLQLTRNKNTEDCNISVNESMNLLPI